MRALARCSLLAWAGAWLVEEATADCGSDEWPTLHYGGDRCYNDGDTMVVNCNSGNGDQCGARLTSGEVLGSGSYSLTLKAVPGSGAVTSFYLSTNEEGMYRPDLGGWNEIDFEILGLQASAGKTRIWTNLFTGTAQEHHKMIEVPFDVTADFHTYTIAINEKQVKWLVDWKAYRTEDISAWGDLKSSIEGARFRRFFSVWGKASYESIGCDEFRDALGGLEANPGPFPLQAKFKMGTPEKQSCAHWGCLNSSVPGAACQCHPGCKNSSTCCHDYHNACDAASDKKHFTDWQCFFYDWKKGEECHDGQVIGGFQNRFFGKESPCGHCWCCKRPVGQKEDGVMSMYDAGSGAPAAEEASTGQQPAIATAAVVALTALSTGSAAVAAVAAVVARLRGSRRRGDEEGGSLLEATEVRAEVM